MNRRWPRPQFSLLTFLIFITVSSPIIGYLAQRRIWNGRRIAALEALEKKGVFRLRSLGPAPNPSDLTFWPRLANTFLMEYRIPPVKKIQLFDEDGDAIVAPSPTDEDLQLLKLFPEIEEVFLSHAGAITDEGLTSLAHLPSLKMINLQSMAKVRGTFLAPLTDSKALTGLHFEHMPSLEGESLRSLKEIEKLDYLKLGDCPKISSESLKSASLPQSFRRLSLVDVQVGDETLIRWLSETKLLMLSLHLDFSRDIAPAMANQTELESIFIVNAPLEDPDFEFVGKCKNLQQLILNGMPIRGDFLRDVKDDSALRYMSLRSTLLSDENASEFVRFKNLQTLDLHYTPLEGVFFAKATQWPMKSVDLGGVEFTELGKNALAKIAGPKISFPRNWSWEDMRRAPDAKVAFEWRPNQHMRTSPDLNGNFHLGGVYLDRDQVDRIDRCSAELMAPVIRLHQLATGGKK